MITSYAFEIVETPLKIIFFNSTLPWIKKIRWLENLLYLKLVNKDQKPVDKV